MRINFFLLCLTLLAFCSLNAQTTYTLADTVLAKQYMEEARVLMGEAKYDAALGKLDTAGVIYRSTVGVEDTTYANVLHQKGRYFYYTGDYDRGIACFQKALEIRLKKSGTEHPDVATSYVCLGGTYFRKGDYDRGIAYFQKALEVQLKKSGAEHPYLVTSHIGLGGAYFRKGDYDRGIAYFQKALEVQLKKSGAEHPDVANIYSYLGQFYSHIGDYDLAIEYNQKAMEIRLKRLGAEHPDVAISYSDLGTAYSYKGDYDRAIKYNQKALEIQLTKLGAEHHNVAYSYHSLGIAYSYKGDYNRAIEYNQKALEIRLKRLGTEHPDVANSYNSLGNAYRSKGDYDRSIEYHQKSLEIKLKKLGPERPIVATSYYSLGIAYSNKGDYDRAIEYHQKSLEIWLKKLGAEYIDVMHSYNKLGLIYKSKGNYTKSADNFKKALSSINAYRKNHENPRSKSTLNKSASGIYESGIATNHLLYQRTDSLHYLHEAFQYAEQSKALSLYESMKNSKALHLAGIPDSLLQKEYDLRVDIAYNEKHRQDLYSEGKEETDSTVLNISSKLFDLHRAYENLVRTFETGCSDYYRLKYDFHTEDVTSIQRDLLQPDQAMLMYHVGDSSVFIFLVKKDDYRVIEVKKDFPLEDWVQQLQHGIYGYRMDSLQHDTLAAFAAEEYTEAAWRLYQKLLAPVDSLLPWRVVIIPDGVLGYVPFEALLTEKPAKPQRFHSHQYFCLQHDLSYCYSATLLREMVQKQHKKEPKGSLVAFAPFYGKSYRHLEDLFGGVILNTSATDTSLVAATNRKDFKPLPKSGEEVAAISKIWDVPYFINADATETRFSQMADDYRILHLATHGLADSRAGDYSYLAFAQVPDSIENELLYVREIYNLSLNADLVTLSACETGIGELQRGEGIISLARAFSYAGAKSIVTTLWSVDDAPTKNLMAAFYKNLKDGMAKDAALAQAQRSFLKTPNAHPYFWASFVAIGDTHPIYK